ncbi:ABC transporter ATP-binding protein [Spiroplasma endosymbiont of Cantharis nigra]|uniref:ABC transporter ATP-binding protein n=1 Tax=Spiroplasma endosymbiont of Cantharis nigra TaxID=3066278 RepID=UPI0030D4D1BC
MKNSTIIKFDNFLKKFKKSAIGPINFEIKQNRIVAFLGSSGSGKTVILNSLIGATKKYSGDIFIDKHNRKKIGNHILNKQIGIYIQMDFSLYDMKAYNFLKTMASIYGVKKELINEKVKYWMEYFSLWESKDKSLRNFSWGMKNRINFILCFLKDPNIIIMDEPGANLDSIWRNKVKNLLIKFKNEGKTIIFTVHNIDEMTDIIDDYIIIERGKLIFLGSKEELNIYNKYKVFLDSEFEVEELRSFLNKRNIKSFKFDLQENSIVIATNNTKEINWLFLFFLKKNIPIKNLVKLPVNMESIHKALESKN